MAADVRHHPYGTQLYLPGYGWGRVEDNGGRSLGANNVELYFDSRQAARAWGERSLPVMSVQPQADAPRTPKRVVEEARVRVVAVPCNVSHSPAARCLSLRPSLVCIRPHQTVSDRPANHPAEQHFMPFSAVPPLSTHQRRARVSHVCFSLRLSRCCCCCARWACEVVIRRRTAV